MKPAPQPSPKRKRGRSTERRSISFGPRSLGSGNVRLLSSFASAFAVALGLVGPASGHGTSKSFAEWTISGAEAKLRVNFAAHDVFAAVVGLDADGDQKLSPAELERGSAAFGDRIVAQSELSNEQGTCAGGAAVVRGVGDPVEEIQVEASFRCPSSIQKLRLSTRYLPELEPPHLSVSTVISGKLTAQHVFAASAPLFELELDPPTVAERLAATFASGLQVGLQPAHVLLAVAVGALSSSLFGAPTMALLLLICVLSGLLFEGAPPWTQWAVSLLLLAQAGVLGSGGKIPRPVVIGLGAASGVALGAGSGAGLATGLGAAVPVVAAGLGGAVAARLLGKRAPVLGFGLAMAGVFILANKVLG